MSNFIKQDQSLSTVLDNLQSLLKVGTEERNHAFRFAVLGTQGAKAPALRYVVLRQVDEEGRLIFFTDQRSSKVKELVADPLASLLFYHPDLRLQLRVEGEMTLQNQNAFARKYHDLLKGESWKAYGSTLAPGKAIDNPEEAYDWNEQMAEDNFTVMCLVPTSIELLQLNGLTHLRAQFVKSASGWNGQWLVP